MHIAQANELKNFIAQFRPLRKGLKSRQARPETAKVIAVHVGEYRNGGDKSLLSIDYSDSVANIALPSNTFMEGLTTALNEEQD